MKRTSLRIALAASGVAALSFVTAGVVAAAPTGTAGSSSSGVPSFQEFADGAYQDIDGQYVVNGDEVEGSRGSLRQFYDRMVAEPSSDPDSLIVNTVSGNDDKWSASQALNLTYCVSDKFGARKGDIINAMNGGSGLWESASSKVNFVYVPAQDANCTTRNNAVLFSVEPVSTTQYIARAFFPSTGKRSRNVLVDDSIWTSGSWTPANILGHELGHTLGFRHEHTRPEAGTCFEDNNWRPLTPYDSSSIMHYPQCNGGSANLQFQASDATGVRALYGS
jgi:hypothetical protein